MFDNTRNYKMIFLLCMAQSALCLAPIEEKMPPVEVEHPETGEREITPKRTPGKPQPTSPEQGEEMQPPSGGGGTEEAGGAVNVPTIPVGEGKPEGGVIVTPGNLSDLSPANLGETLAANSNFVPETAGFSLLSTFSDAQFRVVQNVFDAFFDTTYDMGRVMGKVAETLGEALSSRSPAAARVLDRLADILDILVNHIDALKKLSARNLEKVRTEVGSGMDALASGRLLAEIGSDAVRALRRIINVVQQINIYQNLLSESAILGFDIKTENPLDVDHAYDKLYTQLVTRSDIPESEKRAKEYKLARDIAIKNIKRLNQLREQYTVLSEPRKK